MDPRPCFSAGLRGKPQFKPRRARVGCAHQSTPPCCTWGTWAWWRRIRAGGQAGADRSAGLGGSRRVRVFQGPLGSAPLGHAPIAPPPEFWTWTRRPRIPANRPRKVIWSTLALGQDPGLADGRARSEGCRRSASTLADWTGLEPRRSPALAPDSRRGLPRAEGSTPPPAPECWSPEGNRYNADRCKRACRTFPGLSLDTGQTAPTRAFSAW